MFLFNQLFYLLQGIINDFYLTISFFQVHSSLIYICYEFWKWDHFADAILSFAPFIKLILWNTSSSIAIKWEKRYCGVDREQW